MGCMLCVCVSLFGKKSEALLCGSLCAEVGVFVFFDKAVRASCSSHIFMLFKGLFFFHINICSTSFDASSYCSDTQGSNHER